jgi:rRNA maturation endonuclease Nob1
VKLIELVKDSLKNIKKENLKTLHKDKINISISSESITIREMKYKERRMPKPKLEKHEQRAIKEVKQKVKDTADLMNISILLQRLKEELEKAQFIGIDISKTADIQKDFKSVNQLFGQKLLEMKND